ncbi:MAG TPA: type I methionyl aminopeptidase [Candidatus Paceibacterota bacterium]
MIIKNQKDLEILREGGKKLAAVLSFVAKAAVSGVTTKFLDELAEKLILEYGDKPSFKNYKNPMGKDSYPATLCVSINDEVVHGIPDERILKVGDIVGLDIGAWHGGLCTDTAMTILVGGGTNKLVDATKKSLEIGISKVKAGARIGDIGFAIQNFLEKEGFGVVRELVGHGVGNAVHEDPEIPNWGKAGTGQELAEGMVIAIEPMATEGSPKVKFLPDGWTWATVDGSHSAHFEHTLVVTKNGAEILTKP